MKGGPARSKRKALNEKEKKRRRGKNTDSMKNNCFWLQLFWLFYSFLTKSQTPTLNSSLPPLYLTPCKPSFWEPFPGRELDGSYITTKGTKCGKPQLISKTKIIFGPKLDSLKFVLTRFSKSQLNFYLRHYLEQKWI